MILVTGGTGLLGAHLLISLVQEKNQGIRAISRSKKPEKKLKAIAQFYPDLDLRLLDSIEWIHADILDYYALSDAFMGVSEVYHCAAAVSFNPHLREKILQTNVDGTAQVVNLALENGVAKFCHVSSIAAIGGNDKSGIRTESDDWDTGVKRSYYSLSKYLSEMEVWRGIAEGLPATIVNPSVIIGPGIWGESSTAIFQQIWNGMPFYTPGGTGFVDVWDVVNIMKGLMDKEVWGERFIVNSENANYQTLLTYIAESMRKTAPGRELHSFVASAAWRLEIAWSFITRTAPRFTKENKRTVYGYSSYSNDKVKDFLDYQFTSLHDSVLKTGKLLRNTLLNC